ADPPALTGRRGSTVTGYLSEPPPPSLIRRRAGDLRRLGTDVALALSGWAVVAVVATGGHGPARVAAVFAFVLLAPGAAVTRLLPLRDALARVVLTVALSLSLAALA